MDKKQTEFILDIAFDYYGQRKAISTTKTLYIFTRKTEESEWSLQTTFSTGEIYPRVAFSHPRFHNLLFTSNETGKIYIWAEKEKLNGLTSWLKQGQLDCFGPIKDFSITPQSFESNRIWVAAVTSNGKLCVHWWIKQNMWKMWLMKVVSDTECTCIHFNQTLNVPLTLAVGCKKSNETSYEKMIQIFYYDEQRKELLSSIIIDKPHEDDITAISWGKEYLEDYFILASASVDKTCKIWKIEYTCESNDDLTFFWNVQMKYSNIWVFKYTSPFYSISWNQDGSMLSVSGDDDKKPITFLKKNLNFYEVKEKYT